MSAMEIRKAAAAEQVSGDGDQKRNFHGTHDSSSVRKAYLVPPPPERSFLTHPAGVDEMNFRMRHMDVVLQPGEEIRIILASF